MSGASLTLKKKCPAKAEDLTEFFSETLHKAEDLTEFFSETLHIS